MEPAGLGQVKVIPCAFQSPPSLLCPAPGWSPEAHSSPQAGREAHYAALTLVARNHKQNMPADLRAPSLSIERGSNLEKEQWLGDPTYPGVLCR